MSILKLHGKGRRIRWILLLLFVFLITSACDGLSFIHSVSIISSRSGPVLSRTSFLQTKIRTESKCFYDEATTITMGKGDGKKKRKKKSATVSTPAPPSPAPLRVTNDSNISVKRQIRWAKMKKEYQSGGTAFRQKNVRRTAYRKSLGRYTRGRDSVDIDFILC